jgi:hypothetical protein
MQRKRLTGPERARMTQILMKMMMSLTIRKVHQKPDQNLITSQTLSHPLIMLLMMNQM